MLLWAVHISDGVLTTPFWVTGFLLAACLLFWGSRIVRDEDIPRIAFFTAACFIASTIHIKVPPTSVHLLLNGLAGVILGLPAAIAISVGLFLQALLLGHGGFYALGVNVCVLSLPALAAFVSHRLLMRHLLSHRGMVCSLLVFASGLVLALGTAFSLAMIAFVVPGESTWQENLDAAVQFVFQPWLVVIAVTLALAGAVLERLVHATGHFALGFFIGSCTVLATSGLNCVVLLLGGERVWPVAPWALVVLHLPVALVEGFVIGVSLQFLMRVKPELLLNKIPAPEAVTMEV